MEISFVFFFAEFLFSLFLLNCLPQAGGEGGERVGEVGGALDGGEQTIVARIMLTSAKMTYGEATTGRRKTGGWILSKDTKQVPSETVEVFSSCFLRFEGGGYFSACLSIRGVFFSRFFCEAQLRLYFL